MINKIESIQPIYKLYNNTKNNKNQEVFKMSKETKQFILVTNTDMYESLIKMGFKGLLQNINNQKVYSFQVTDKLYKFLKKSTFTKKDYFFDNKLRF